MPSGLSLRQLANLCAGCLVALLLADTSYADAMPMWEVDGASNHVRILGSVHFLRPGRDALPSAVMATYEDAEVLLMELDLDDLDAGANQALVQRLAIDPQGRSLEQLLGPRDYRLATERAGALGIDLSALQGLEPWLAAVTISQVQLQKLGLDAAAGVEQQLARMAARDHKEIRGLETIEEQLAAMDALSPAAQRAFLLQTLDDAAGMRDEIDQMIGAWKSGDMRAMETEFLDSVREQPELYQRIVVNRNRDWSRKLAPLTRDRQDYLVVVGTLHLVGPDSLIRMLSQSGQAVHQLGTGPESDVASQ